MFIMGVSGVRFRVGSAGCCANAEAPASISDASARVDDFRYRCSDMPFLPLVRLMFDRTITLCLIIATQIGVYIVQHWERTPQRMSAELFHSLRGPKAARSAARPLRPPQ